MERPETTQPDEAITFFHHLDVKIGPNASMTPPSTPMRAQIVRMMATEESPAEVLDDQEWLVSQGNEIATDWEIAS